MQCELVIWEKHRRRIFFSLLQCKEIFFFHFLCAFSTMQPFFFLPCTFATIQTCQMQEEKEAHLLLLFCYNTKKKLFLLIACFLTFFLLQYFISLWHAIAQLHGIKTHMLLFIATTYPILLLFLYFSSTPLFFWLQCFLMHP